MIKRLFKLAAILATMIAPRSAFSQSEGSQPAPIKDNSFLIEEAYNQEPGVVQWIATVQHFASPSRYWGIGVTNEIPLHGMRHQLSWTVPGETNEFEEFGWGRIALHYRFQLEDGSSGTACAPRVSVLLPTDKVYSIGTEKIEWQINLPVSLTLTERIVMHVNAGATYSPGHSVNRWISDEPVQNEDFLSYSAGASVVWLAHPNANLLLEVLHSSFEDFVSASLEHFQVERFDETVVNPGIRVAVNPPFGQFVPGIALPIRIADGETDIGVFGYLSFEHSL